MFCKHCGKQLTDGAKFCPDCGTPVSAKAQHTQQHFEATTSHKQTPYNEAAHPTPHNHEHRTQQTAKTASHNRTHPTQTINHTKSSVAGSMNYTASDMTTAPAPKVRRNFTIGNIVTWIGCFLAFISVRRFTVKHSVSHSSCEGRYLRLRLIPSE